MYQSQGDTEQLAQTITTNIRKISQNVNSMQQMTMQLQSSPSSDNESVRQQFHQMQTYTQQLAKDTNKLLKELSQGTGSRSKIHKERLASDFSDALQAFQSVQRKEVDQERAEVKRVRAASQHGNQPDFGQVRPPPGRHDVESGYQQQALMMEEESNLEMLREREEAVRTLEQNIMDVNGIFKEIATMVHEQAEAVDSIEANVDSATIRVQEGAEQLTLARTHHEKAQRKKFCLIIFGIIVLAIIITIIVLTSK